MDHAARKNSRSARSLSVFDSEIRKMLQASSIELDPNMTKDELPENLLLSPVINIIPLITNLVLQIVGTLEVMHLSAMSSLNSKNSGNTCGKLWQLTTLSRVAI